MSLMQSAGVEREVVSRVLSVLGCLWGGIGKSRCLLTS